MITRNGRAGHGQRRGPRPVSALVLWVTVPGMGRASKTRKSAAKEKPARIRRCANTQELREGWPEEAERVAVLAETTGGPLDEYMHGAIERGSASAALKIKALAVEPEMRRHGIATALLSGCTDLYDRLGYFMQYGSFRAGSGLGAFYRARGFDLVPRNEGIDMYVSTGVRSYIGSDGNEQLFVRWHR